MVQWNFCCVDGFILDPSTVFVILIVSWFQTWTWAYWVRTLLIKTSFWIYGIWLQDPPRKWSSGPWRRGSQPANRYSHEWRKKSPGLPVYLYRQFICSGSSPVLECLFLVPLYLPECRKILWPISFVKLCLIISSPKVMASSSEILCHPLAPGPRN